MKRVTITDVAREAKVSKSTVSQYLNERYDYMSEETKKKIEGVIDELGYKVNVVARSLTQKRTSTIGIIVANILHNFSTQIIRVIEDYFNEHGIHVIVCNADDDPKKEKEYIEMLIAKQVDGLIVFPTGGNIKLYNNLVEEKYPLVFIDRLIDKSKVETILLDNKHGAKLAVDHLLDYGHKNIAIVTTSIIKNITPRIERIEGYKEALANHGIDVRNDFIVSNHIDKLEESIDKLMHLIIKPTAIFAANDLALMELLKYINKNNLNIPEDISVVSIDDVPFASVYNPGLTIISQPTFEMGRKAAKVLLAYINKKRMFNMNQNEYRFKGSIITRKSVRTIKDNLGG